MKRWIYRPEVEGALPPSASLAERLGISDLLLRLLLRRGLSSVQDMDVYLSPQLRHLAPLEEWPGLAEAAGVITAGITAGMPFAVWGDYDVDGVTSTALVHDVLEFHGVDVRHHLPDRRAEGYGLNVEWIERLAADGVRLLLTVDCGISDVVPISRARELGMTVVVSDHHLPPEVLPPAHAICNPRLACCPCPALAGVGVAFFVMAAVNAALGERSGRRYDMREVLDLVALGTLADVVDLGGQNRILVKNGLLKIAEARRPGMAALKAVAGYNPSASLGAGQVVFGLAPRINAAGRLGEAEMALQLLRARKHGEAAQLAQRLDAMNTDRRVEEDRILEEAKRQAESQAASRMGFVLHGEDWHPGVIGIVASRIVEAYYRPTLILCTEGETLKGSGRSVSEFDLHAGLSQCADLFLGFGGAQAGRRHEPEDLGARCIARTVRYRGASGPRRYAVDGIAEAGWRPRLRARFGFHGAQGTRDVAAFGTGNAEPVFASPPLLVRGLRRFGKAREHVELELTDESCGVTLHAKAWRQSGEFSDRLRGTRIRLAYTPRIDRYSGAASVDLRIRDWQPA